ncbi:NUDIX domain-containing protein [Microseira sp. BLCC-F43]|jgi:8-oxo-dGTP pyrophosphatase MutT (NUDIX family)|uniref:NUDIX domain-containing protein n=1 Tax=Microseira sp. BLCC-F43 TaxID=3153602 RepID=UPI0035BA792A
MNLPNTSQIHVRHRGTAIVETNAGILIVQESNGVYSLPGGGVHQGESTEAATIRELREETGLEAVWAQFLFDHMGRVHSVDYRQRQNQHAVFLIEAIGSPQPNDGIVAIRFYRPGDDVIMGQSAGQIIEKYLRLKHRLVKYSTNTVSTGNEKPGC